MAEIHSSGGDGGRLVLPEELLEEILVRLPVKSILRFESVCKAWRSKFHSGPFVALFRGGDYKSEPFHTIALEDVYRMAPGLADGDEEKRVISAVGLSSNGIYCLTSVYRNNVPPRQDVISLLAVKIALCNPGTRQVKYLEPFPPEFRPLLARISEDRCQLAWGLGTVQTSSSSLDYRVVMVINYSKRGSWLYCPCFLVLVYSSQRGEWERIVDYRPDGERNEGGPSPDASADGIGIEGRGLMGMFAPTETVACPQRFFKGCWHWVTMRLGEDRDSCYLDVMSFNFAAQSFKLIGGPPDVSAVEYMGGQITQYYADVVVLHHHLAAIYLSRQTDFGVWMMMDYGVQESWTRIYTINNCLASKNIRLYGIDYSEEEEESGGIRIKRLLFADPYSWEKVAPDSRVLTGEIFSFDDKGQGQRQPQSRQATTLRGRSDQICLSTAGISTYVETLQRL